MQQKAIVIKEEGEFATVQVMRQDACAHCHVKCGNSCQHAVQAKAQNLVAAKEGDTVLLQSHTGRLLLFAVAVFCFPIAVGFLSYFLWSGLGAPASYLLSAFVGVIVFLVMGILCDRAVRKNPDLQIIEVIAPSCAENGDENDRA